MGVEDDFEEIHIIDLQVSNQTKKDVFKQLIEVHKLNKSDIVVIGDDINSEIKAAIELGIDCYLYDRANISSINSDIPVISNFGELAQLI